MPAYRIHHYLTEDSGRDSYLDWLQKLLDRRAVVAIIRRVIRIELGNFGDHRFCRDGVWEMRIDAGPGYRVYYAFTAKHTVMLLCGGTKRTQDADIDKAVSYWIDWQRRPDHEKQTP